MIEIKDKNVWDNFVKSFPQRTFVNSWDWGEFRKSLGDKIWRMGLFKNGELESIFLASKVYAKKGNFLLLNHFPIIKENSVLEEVLFNIKKIAIKEKVSFVRIAPISNEPLDGFIDSSSRVFPTRSWVLDISTSEDEILSGMRKEYSRRIRKASRNKDIEVVISNNINDIDLFYSLMDTTSKRQGFSSFSKEYLKKEFDVFSLDNNVFLSLGYYKKRLVAGALVVLYSGKAFYHHGASEALSSTISVPQIVQWVAIKEAKRRGATTYDFWSIAPDDNPSHKWAGLTFFKKSFGGYAINYPNAKDLPMSKRYWLTYVFEKIKR